MGKRYRTGDQALVREMNLSVILNYLRETSPLSRAQLAEITGLNKTTVSSLVRELIARKFVREIGFDSSGGGRPAVLLELNPDAGCIIGMEIGVDFILAVLTDFKAQVLWRHREDTDQAEGQEAILAKVLDIVRQALTVGESTQSPVLGIGVGVPGLVDVSSGTLLFAPNLKWHDVPLREVFSREFEVLVFVDNDANVAALGERYFGAAQRSKDFVYLSIGVGLGGGIVLDGQYQSILIPLVQTLQKITIFGVKFYGSIPGLVLAHVIYGIPITTLIFRNYYANVPTELIEAARIDGANIFGIYRHVLFPLSLPGFVVVMIWQFTSIWNDFLFAVTVTSNPEAQPITVGLNNLAGSYIVEWNVQMAGSLIAALPTLLVYIFLGRFFMRGLMAGSLKG